MKKNIKVSVIATSFNQDCFIKQALDSVFMQKDINFEVLLADDCSTDNTLKIMKEYVKKYPNFKDMLSSKT